jgi:hypothetical protein
MMNCQPQNRKRRNRQFSAWRNNMVRKAEEQDLEILANLAVQ